MDAAVGAWFDRALSQKIEDEETLDECLHLCREFSRPPRSTWLPAGAAELVRFTLELEDALVHACEAAELLAAFPIPTTGSLAAPRALKRFRLVPTMLCLPADIGRLRGRLAELDHRDLHHYLSLLYGRVAAGGQIGEVLLSHVATVATLPAGALPAQALEEIAAAIRARPEGYWRGADLARLEQAVRLHGPALADHYARCAEARRPARRRPFRWFWPFGRRTGPAQAAGTSRTSGKSGKSRKKKGR